MGSVDPIYMRWVLFYGFLLSSGFSSILGSDNKVFYIVGDLVGTGEAKGRSYFSVRNEGSGKIQHILCQESVVQELSQSLGSQTKKSISTPKIHINVKATIFQIGSPLLTCVSHPRIRGGTSIHPTSHSSTGLDMGDRDSWGVKKIIGQVLEADAMSGLLTIQTGRRKTYLKVSPELAESIHKKLSEMEVQTIDDEFRYDRSKGYFVGTKNLSID